MELTILNSVSVATKVEMLQKQNQWNLYEVMLYML